MKLALNCGITRGWLYFLPSRLVLDRHGLAHVEGNRFERRVEERRVEERRIFAEPQSRPSGAAVSKLHITTEPAPALFECRDSRPHQITCS